MNKGIIDDIKSRLPDLSPSERRVGEWILANSRKCIDQSINEVAVFAEVSDPTVVRFCRSIGLAGFRELRTRLIAAQQKPQSFFHHDVSIEDQPADAAIKVLESSVQALVELRESISAMPFQPAIDKLNSARQIIFAGLGASGIVAQDACHKFFRLGIPCTTALDPQTIIQQASISHEEDVFVCISHTGKWPALLDSMKLVIERGATVIAITDQQSPLAEIATLTFHCHPSEDTNVFTPMSSRLAQLTLLDAVQVAFAIKIGSYAEENLRLTKNALKADNS